MPNSKEEPGLHSDEVGAELGASHRTFTSRISAATSSFVWGGSVGNTLRDMAAGCRAIEWVSPCVG